MSRLYFALGLVLACSLSPAIGARSTATRSTTHVVRRGQTLSGIAQRYGVSLRDLRQWNGLQGDRLLVDQRLEIRRAAPAEWYVVRSGDTLSEIAARFGGSLANLRRLNRLEDDGIVPGQKLRLRPPTAADPPEGHYVVKPADTLSEIALAHGLSLRELVRLNGLRGDAIRAGQQLRVLAATAQVGTPPKPKTSEYLVREGDTLSEIALAYGLDLDRLKALNGLNGDTIRVGQKLRIQSGAGEPRDRILDGPREYAVRRGDTLSEIAQRFEVGLALLRQLNGLTSDQIRPGQKLRLRPSSRDEPVHVVRYGETLSEIALLYDLELDLLRRLNGIERDRIIAGQKLRLREAQSAAHIVERGDALWEIARAYSMTVAELKELNGLASDHIYPGQELRLNPAKSSRLATYLVSAGDNLSEIARLHQMSIDELRRLNRLEGSIIHPGQELKVRPLLGAGIAWLDLADIPWKDLQVAPAGVPRIEAGNGPYFGVTPRVPMQQGRDYYEGNRHSPRKTYLAAAKLWQRFDQAVSKVGRLSNALAGWHIVIDPGHGGLDPGAIVPSLDGDGKRLYVVEDEYCYDVALRSYVLLKLHGADVHITVLSPNHLIRQSKPPSLTFVHEKNEVYNSAALSRSGGSGEWPRGTLKGLLNRVQIAREALAGAARSRTLFLSFHADISRDAPDGSMVLYYESRDGKRRDTVSHGFARSLLPALGAGAHTRGQALAVLRDNPARYKVLLEMRNLAYVDHAWALRFEQLRHRDAEKLVKGVLDFARSRQLAQR
ncbi:LysM peptidoglycan-binding domain-containing protein [Candidatus Latescibacterota bacterium]